MISSLLLIALLPWVSAVSRRPPAVFEPPVRFDLNVLEPPEEERRTSRNNIVTSWVTMPLDHFDPQNNATFQMRFMYNEEFFGGDGYPVFILVGGEWSIAEGWLMSGNMYLMAQENHGHQIYTEHRYYGQTLPFLDFTAENLRYLNVDQALADLAYFIKYLKREPRFADSKIILYGGSYAGNMALWFKQRYPHLALGVVASSGPILGEVDYSGYLEVVHNAFLSEGGEQCINVIRDAVNDIVENWQTPQGRENITNTFRLCTPIDFDDRFQKGYFFGAITWTFSGEVQYARPGTLRALCDNLIGDMYGTSPMEKIAGFLVGGSNACLSVAHENLINAYSVRSNSRAWYYQTCTEYGYYQIAPSSGTVFDPFEELNVEFYVDICKRVFTDRFDEQFVYDAVDRVNSIFGGLTPNVNNTINIHGTIDPWHVLGVYEKDLKETSPTITVPRASHCFDMQNWLSSNTIQMTQAQTAARRIVAQWLA